MAPTRDALSTEEDRLRELLAHVGRRRAANIALDTALKSGDADAIARRTAEYEGADLLDAEEREALEWFREQAMNPGRLPPFVRRAVLVVAALRRLTATIPGE